MMNLFDELAADAARDLESGVFLNNNVQIPDTAIDKAVNDIEKKMNDMLSKKMNDVISEQTYVPEKCA